MRAFPREVIDALMAQTAQPPDFEVRAAAATRFTWSCSGQAKGIPRLLLDAPPSTEGVQGHGGLHPARCDVQRVPGERPQGQWP